MLGIRELHGSGLPNKWKGKIWQAVPSPTHHKPPTQAGSQGVFAAHALAGVTDEMAFGFNFELFTHVTCFCGMKVVLLGLYNRQGLQETSAEDTVSYSRTRQGVNLHLFVCPSLCAVLHV
ncbi:hypothetical protein ABBQ38_002601 [Trebouxia sp. C0009 RCD-2024]